MSTFNIGVNAPNVALSATSNSVPRGFYVGGVLSQIDTDLVVENIASGVTIFGKVGTLNTGGGITYTMPTTGQTIEYWPYDNGHTGYVLPTATRSFTDNGDNTITDNGTGLMWVKDTVVAGISGTYDWANAISTCDTLSYASHNDWRLPNFRELESLVDYAFTEVSASANAHSGFNLINGRVWTSTSQIPISSNHAMAITFYSNTGGYNYYWLWGKTDVIIKTTALYIRPVRNVT